MTTIGRYIRHQTAGTSGADFDTDQPLGAGRCQLLLANNAAHLAERNSIRVLANHQGVAGIYLASTKGSTWTTPGTGQSRHATDVYWSFGPSTPHLAIPLGTHFLHYWPGTRTYPTLTVSFTEWVASGHTLGVYLVACPGTTWPTTYSRTIAATYTDATATARTISLGLRDLDVRQTMFAPVSGIKGDPPTEQGRLGLVSLFLGAFVSEGVKNTDVGNVVGISLYTEAP